MVNGACLLHAWHVHRPELTRSSRPLGEADAHITTTSQMRKLRPVIHSRSLTRSSVIQTHSVWPHGSLSGHNPLHQGLSHGIPNQQRFHE